MSQSAIETGSENSSGSPLDGDALAPTVFERVGIFVAVVSGVGALMVVGFGEFAENVMPPGLDSVKTAVILGVGAIALAFYSMELRRSRVIDAEMAETSKDIAATVAEIRARQEARDDAGEDSVDDVAEEFEQRVKELEVEAVRRIRAAAKSTSS